MAKRVTLQDVVDFVTALDDKEYFESKSVFSESERNFSESDSESYYGELPILQKKGGFLGGKSADVNKKVFFRFCFLLFRCPLTSKNILYNNLYISAIK